MKKLSNIARAVGLSIHNAATAYMARSGLMLHALPTKASMMNYAVTDANQSEVIRQRLYDFQLYAAAGKQQFTFFANPVGQGVTSTPGAVVGSQKQYSDTNMEAANTLPSGKMFQVETIEVVFLPGSVSTADTFTPGSIMGALGAIAAAQVGAVNDTALVYNTGLLSLKILDKNYLREPLLKSFPPKTHLELDTSIAGIDSDLAVTTTFGAQNIYAAGRPYYMDPPITLQPTVNFSISIDYPAAQALPSGFNGRIGVILDGFMLRASQ
jgi:hypothetical protein